MTIEIRQMVIRAVVDRKVEPGVPVEVRGGGPLLTPAYASAAPAASGQQDALVAACVREVLRQLERSRER